MILFLLIRAVGVVLVVATLPLLAELLVLTLAALVPMARVKDESEQPEAFPLSVLIPAYNEEALIGRCVRSILDSTSSTCSTEVLVVAHNCSDATAAEAEAAGARVLVLNDPARAGKGWALNLGFAAALAGPSQAVLVIDADSVVCPGMVEAVQQKFKRGARALQCRYEVHNSQDSWRTNLMTLALRAFNVIRPRGRARLGLSAGIFGNGFALHRDVISSIPYGAFSVVEDLEYHLKLIQAGIRVEFVDTATVLGEMPVSAKGARVQRARWEGGRLHIMKQWAPRLMGGVLRGQMTLLEPLLDLLALPITSEVSLLMVAACLPLTWLRWYALVGFAILLLHVTAASIGGPGLWRTMKALMSAPAHILWKLLIFPEIWRASRANALWVRTNRESPVDGR